MQCPHCKTVNSPEASYCSSCGAALKGSGVLAPGTVLQRGYRVIRQLGGGGMGDVYLVEHIGLGEQMALKEVRTTTLVDPVERDRAVQQFQGEARILARLRHRHLPRVTDFFEENNRQYLVMDQIEGETLDDILARTSGFLPEGKLIEWAIQVCNVLEYLHSQNPPVIFRDLKPANIMIERRSGLVKLIDFGIARLFNPTKGTDTLKMGTPGYAPPEQYGGLGGTDPRADLYALGATLHHLATSNDPQNEPPFYFPHAPVKNYNPTISNGLGALIDKATSYRREDRFASAAQMRAALETCRAGATQLVITSPPTSPDPGKTKVIREPVVRETPRKERSRAWLLWAGLGVIVVVGIVLFLVLFNNFDGTPASRPEPTQVVAVPRESQGFVCKDPLGCVTYEPDQPVLLASALAISGPNADLGLDAQRGVEIAIDFKGGVKGHPIELHVEDEHCSPDGGHSAAEAIISNPTIIAVVGTTCSTAAVPMIEILSDAGYVLVSPSNTNPSLTDPTRAWRPGYLRTAYNDQMQGNVMAEFAFNGLGLRTAAVIHDSEPYSQDLAIVFADTFIEMGGTIVAVTPVNRGETEMGQVLEAIVMAGPPEFLFYPVFAAEGGFLTRQARQIPGLENTILAAGDGMISQASVEAVGEAGEGMYLSGPDLSYQGELYERFIGAYAEKYGSEPVAAYHAHAFDATNLIFDCLEKIGIEDHGSLHIGRQALRTCLYDTRGFPGLTGSLTCNQFGDCGDSRIVVYQLRRGEYIPVWP
jgi:branched-chain amino acid transport system substrate-binding protein